MPERPEASPAVFMVPSLLQVFSYFPFVVGFVFFSFPICSLTSAKSVQELVET